MATEHFLTTNYPQVHVFDRVWWFNKNMNNNVVSPHYITNTVTFVPWT